VVYSGVLLAMATVATVFDPCGENYIWIDHSNYPGGPLRYYAASSNLMPQLLRNYWPHHVDILTGSSCAHISLIGLLKWKRNKCFNTTVDSCINAT